MSGGVTPVSDHAGAHQPFSGVIWLTGYSGSGKTTVGRHVASLLRARGVHVMSIDGDDLRAIFGGGWGYEREDRLKLAHIYFRLCDHLARQGAVVVISAVAMFEEVRQWVRANIASPHLVYLDVPHDVRLARDSRTKHVYSDADVESLYEEPLDPEVRIENYGSTSPEEAALVVVESFLSVRSDG